MGLIGAALGAAGSIFGGISASAAMKKVKRNVERQQRENEDWYNRRYNEDSTQRADAQRLLNKTEDSIRLRNRQAAGTQAVMGGTDESAAAARAANNQAISDAAGQIAAKADARKDSIEQAYRQKDEQYEQQLNQIEANKAGAISQAVQGVTGLASSIPF